MNKSIINNSYLSFIIATLILIAGCKKDVSLEPKIAVYKTTCDLNANISADTNYIPHKRNNLWTYCATIDHYISCTVIADTFINNKTYFKRLYSFPDPHLGINYYTENVSYIDSTGSYYSITNELYYSDTLKIIKPNAVNGDTLYNNLNTLVKVVLVNKNEVVETISNCYHIRVIYPSRTTEHIYRKGIGELFFEGGKLTNSKIF